MASDEHTLMAVAAPSKITVVPIRHPEQLRRLANDLTKMFERFLKKAGEPLTFIEQWDGLLRALGTPETLFLLAVDERIRPVGFVLAMPTHDSFWKVQYANVTQMHAEKKGVVEEFLPIIEDWARAQQCRFVLASSRRSARAIMRRFKMKPYTVTFIRDLENGEPQ